MYLVREVLHCRRGKAPEIVADLKAFNSSFVEAGNTTGRIFVDMSGRFDTVVFQWEEESLDAFYTKERADYVDPEPESAELIRHMNDNTVEGYREIYEIII